MLAALAFTNASAQPAAAPQRDAIESAATQCNQLDWRADRLRWGLSGLRDRARRNDPTQRLDILRFVGDLDQLVGEMLRLNAALKDILDAAKPDPDSIEPAKALHAEAEGLRSAGNFLLNEINWGAGELEQAGFSIEAFKIKQGAQASFDFARAIHSRSVELRGRVQAPSS